MAVYCHETGHTGDYIDISIMDTQAGSIDRQTFSLLRYQYNGRRSSRSSAGETYLRGIYPCKDGYVDMWGQDRFPQVAGMLGMPELMEIPLFAAPEAREQPEVVQSLDEIVQDWFCHHTRREILERAQHNRVLLSPLYSMDEVLEDSHFRAREFWVTADRPHVGAVEYPGRPFQMEASPWQLLRPAPLLGQHNEEVYCGMLGYSADQLIQMRQMSVI
jgi:crotonobetainyl-CoA:carnitine CoA-transferase CaiB-like acyl-CoA transferase